MQEQEERERTLNEGTATTPERCRSSNDEAEGKNDEVVENVKNVERCEENEKCLCDDKVVNNNGRTGTFYFDIGDRIRVVWGLGGVFDM